MKLITELNEEVSVDIQEDAKTPGKKNYYIEGVFMAGSEGTLLEINKNRRSYPLGVLREEIARYNAQYVKENRAFGELGHPPGPTINLDRVSHMIVMLEQRGNKFYGRAKILETPMGLIARSLLESGARLAVSSRGVGNLVEKNGYFEVKEDFRLATPADLVADPSCQHAFVNGIMEGKDWCYSEERGWYEGLEEKVKKTFSKKLSEEDRELLALKAFEKYLSLLEQNIGV